MGDILPFRRKEGEKPLNAYEAIAWERAMEERKSTRPVSKWLQAFRDAKAEKERCS